MVMDVLGGALVFLSGSTFAVLRVASYDRRFNRDLSRRVAVLAGLAFLIGIGLLWAGGGL